MLGMERDEDHSGVFEETGDSSGTASNAEGVELFATQWLYHTMKFLEIEPRMSPQLGQVELLQKSEHLGGGFAYRQFRRHDGIVKSRANLNPHATTCQPLRRPALQS
jgi:hypothetical protein